MIETFSIYDTKSKSNPKHHVTYYTCWYLILENITRCRCQTNPNHGLYFEIMLLGLTIQRKTLMYICFKSQCLHNVCLHKALIRKWAQKPCHNQADIAVNFSLILTIANFIFVYAHLVGTPYYPVV